MGVKYGMSNESCLKVISFLAIRFFIVVLVQHLEIFLVLCTSSQHLISFHEISHLTDNAGGEGGGG